MKYYMTYRQFPEKFEHKEPLLLTKIVDGTENLARMLGFIELSPDMWELISISPCKEV